MTREERLKLIVDLAFTEAQGVTFSQIMQELRINAYDEADSIIQELIDEGELLTLQLHGKELIHLSPMHVNAVHATKYSAGADVFAKTVQDIGVMETVLIEAEFKVPTHLKNTNNCFFALPRSSFWENHKLLLTNGVGLIDSDYPDSVFFSYCNMGDKPVTIERGNKVGQLVLMATQQFAPVLQKVREGGFGSTDVDDNDTISLEDKLKDAGSNIEIDEVIADGETKTETKEEVEVVKPKVNIPPPPPKVKQKKATK